MPGKVASMRDAVADLVRDGDTVAIEGFTHLIGFSAGHEIIRQRKRDLTLARMTPDLVYDQMIAGGVARKLIFSWLGNPGVGGLNAIRRRIEPASVGEGTALEVEEYSHFGMVSRYTAGAANLPFMPLRSYFETDLPKANPLIRPIKSPYSDEVVYAVPPLNPDVTVIHAQRADASGNTQIWGLLGCQKEAAFAADRVIVVVEELVEESVIRADPNRTVIPGLIVDAVVVDPFGAHPSYVQGAYDRDNRFYLDWDPISRDEEKTQAWLREWVYDLPDRAAYVQKLGAERWAGLTPGSAPSGSVDYGTTDERPGAGPAPARLLQVRDDDRRGRARARRPARLLRRRRPAEHRRQPRQAHRRARHGARLRGGRLRGAAGPAAAVDRRPHHRHRRHGRGLDVRAVRLLPAARPDRRRLPGRGPDRPLRQPQLDGHRRLRRPEDPPARAPVARARSRSTRSRCS